MGVGGKRAVVVGASMAGLLAARVLRDHFDEVLLLERDTLPDGPEERQAVPQAHHIHLLLAKGAEVIEALLPGILAELEEAGACRYDSSADFRWYQAGLWKNRSRSGVSLWGMTRALLEWHVRRRVAALPNVLIRQETTVAQLRAAVPQGPVTGVTLESGEAIDADLVVDASGRGARAPGWLEALGHGAPPETVVKAGLGYTSALFRLARQPDWKLLIMACPPVSFRNGLIGAVEGDRWVVSLTGLFGDHAPTDRDGFLAFAASLPDRDVAEALAGAELLSPISVHKIPSQVRRHYERMASFPDGLIVLGDAACCLSPAFAQGMTVAALEAQLLGDTLAGQTPGSLTGLSRRFQQRLAKLVDGPWQAATGDELQYKETEGVRPPGLGLINWYMGRVVRLSATDPYVQLRFLQVMHLLAPGPSLFEPRILWKVLTATPSALHRGDKEPSKR